MSVAVNLTTTNSNLFSFSQPFSILLLLLPPPLVPLPPPHLGPTNDVIHVRASMLPTGKAALEDLRKLFGRPGPHVFHDATIPISIVCPDAVEYLMFQRRRRSSKVDDLVFVGLFNKAVLGCEKSEITELSTAAAAAFLAMS